MRSFLITQKTLARSRGFTLIEFLGIILIIAVIAAVAVPLFVDLQEGAEDAVVDSVAASIKAGAYQYRQWWLINGDAETGFANYDVDGVTVRFRDGWANTTVGTSLAPPGTPNRNSASARLLHLFLAVAPQPIVTRNDSDSGWVMLRNNQCAAFRARRCWGYRNGDNLQAIISYSGRDGFFELDKNP